MTTSGFAHHTIRVADALTETRAAMRVAVDQLPLSVRRVAHHHFGWNGQHGHSATAGEGKMVRPALALLSAQAVGGRAEDAVSAAVAVELVHNFSLLHDDVMDGDLLRRHRPTAWSVYGIPAAVLAGDALWALAMRVLTETGPAAGQALALLSDALGRLMEGQSADLDFEQRARVTISECEAMAAGKTGAVLGFGCALGALLGGGSPVQVTCLRTFGEQLGLAFQLVDDLLGIWGDPQATGKPVGADLARRKKSLPVVAALASGTSEAGELAALYRLDRRLTPAELVRAAELIERAGGRAWIERAADRYLGQALGLLRQADPVSAVAEEMTVLAEHLAHRDQ